MIQVKLMVMQDKMANKDKMAIAAMVDHHQAKAILVVHRMDEGIFRMLELIH